MFINSFIVNPNELNLQMKYIEYNIEKTREAYGLNTVKKYIFPEMKELSPEIMNRNINTVDNVRIVDYDSTLASDKQLQSNTNFYTFNSGDIVNYVINGKESPVFITAREIDKNKLPNKEYLNTTYRYTHGFGVVFNPINKVTPEGQIDFIVNGIKMDSTDPNLKILEPRIYYGELTSDYVLVGASNGLKEVDFDGNKECVYDGKGGIKLNFLNRLLFSIKYSDINMLISGYISSDTKILLNREIINRAKMALPFLNIDEDPCIVLTDDGKLKWVLDAYTTSEYYPYAQNYGSMNYIRNSVKVVIDAYNGTTKCYIVDKNDPIIKMYKNIYKDVLLDEPIPQDIAKHLRFPEALFEIQTEKMKKYHLEPTDAAIFFSNTDLWDVAKYAYHSTDVLEDIHPYYNMIKLPGQIGEKEELILMRPFTPSGGTKHNMVSWLAVRNSSKNYGEMVLFSFPKNTNILGPDQVNVKITQIDKISKDISLWDQKGSNAYKGDLLVIPIEDSVLYVQPIFIKAESESSIPEMREIVVGYQKGDEFKYGIGNTLDESLNDLFKGTFNFTTGGTNTVPASQDDTNNLNVNIHNNESQNGLDSNTKVDEDLINEIKSKYTDLKKQLNDYGSLIEKLK